MHNSSLLNNVNTGYVIVHCKTAGDAKKISSTRTWKILRNDWVCQAIKFKDGTLMVAFFVAAALKFDNNKVSPVNKPCLILISEYSFYTTTRLIGEKILS
jgi:hypothetical protein